MRRKRGARVRPRAFHPPGFTLSELMVALTGGLFISITVFVLARQGSRFYQREGRVSAATLSSVVGFERLRVDIARAGFLASPNVVADPDVCGAPEVDPLWPAQLKALQSIYIEDITLDDLPDAARAVLENNGITPQRITMAGSYASANYFEVNTIEEQANNYVVSLSPSSFGMQQSCSADSGPVNLACVASIFGVGRAVRIVDRAGRHHYGTITGVQGDAIPQILLARDSPSLALVSAGNAGPCQFSPRDEGLVINVVNFIRYDLRSLADEPGYEALFSSDEPDYDGSRIELIREELDVNGDPIPGTIELVAEYAVDLRFGLTALNPDTGLLFRVASGNMGEFSGNVVEDQTRTPQRIRSVQAWLSVRSREADRGVGLNVDGGTGPLLRVGLGTGGGEPFARVRTVQGQIALNNQLRANWP